MSALADDGSGRRWEVAERVVSRVQDQSLIAHRAPGDRANVVAEAIRDDSPLLGPEAVQQLVEVVLSEVDGMGCLDPLLADPRVSEIMINGAGPVWIERDGRIERTEIVVDECQVGHLIEKAVAPLGLRVDRSSPLVDARLDDGCRVNAVVPPLAVDGPCLTIRRFGVTPVSLETVAPNGLSHLLAWAVVGRCNILVSGGTGAGKTTLLNALAERLADDERVITVEDVAELRLPHSHVVRLEARPPNADGAGRVDIRDLVRNALRMRPDRIIVGEVRGAEALDMLQAMNTGHEGSLSTCHANSPADAVRRLETMILMGEVALPLAAVREQIVSSLDLVVQIARGRDGRRRVVQVAEVDPRTDGAGRPLLRSLTERGALVTLPKRAARLVGHPPPNARWTVAPSS
jgi:pilus assembly protein CpaF